MTAVKIASINFSHVHYDMTSLPYKIHEWFSMFSWRKKIDEVCAKTTNFVQYRGLNIHYFSFTIVIPASIVTSRIHY